LGEIIIKRLKANKNNKTLTKVTLLKTKFGGKNNRQKKATKNILNRNHNEL